MTEVHPETWQGRELTTLAGYHPGVAPLDEHNVKLLDNVHPIGWKPSASRRKRYNMVVLGAGAGGLVSAAGSAGVGAKVAIVEKHLMGGDCLNVGCVPSKAILRCAHVVREAKNAAEFGVDIPNVHVNFGKVMERMRTLRANFSPTDSCDRFQNKLGVDVFQGHGAFTSPSTVEVNGETLSFATAVIATGANARVPDTPGINAVPYLTNVSFWNQTQLPERLLVMGSGPIGLELAQAMALFGSQVTVIERGNRIMGREDPDAAAVVHKQMERDGVHFMLNTTIDEFKLGTGDTVAAHVTQRGIKSLVVSDALLVAVGRVPHVEGIGLEAAGVQYDLNKGIKVKDSLQTTAKHIFAVGDCCTMYKFTHAADFMARAVIRNALFFGSAKMSELVIPRATFTEPEVAAVGKSEAELLEEEVTFEVVKLEMVEVDRAVLDGATEGFVKLLVKPKHGTILGATIVGSEAGNMISEITVAMHASMKLGALAAVIHPYPTKAGGIRQAGDLFNKTRLTPFVKATFDKLLTFRRHGL
ncbi:class-I pyridine nucleotide-disulfide oxidoreductase [Trebouxia sp. C0009 RCD-2024]